MNGILSVQCCARYTFVASHIQIHPFILLYGNGSELFKYFSFTSEFSFKLSAEDERETLNEKRVFTSGCWSISSKVLGAHEAFLTSGSCRLASKQWPAAAPDYFCSGVPPVTPFQSDTVATFWWAVRRSGSQPRGPWERGYFSTGIPVVFRVISTSSQFLITGTPVVSSDSLFKKVASKKT